MTDPTRDHGPQPLVDLMERHGLAAADLVQASTQQLNFKMVARARKGRQLTPNVIGKVLEALNLAAGTAYGASDAFDYVRRPGAAE